MSIGFDVIVLLMPLSVIRTLRMPFQRKFVVMLIFWLGTLCCIAAVMRFVFLYQAIYSLNEHPNGYYVLTKNIHWVEVEPNISVLAASLPMLSPLFNTDKKSLQTILGNWFNFSQIGSIFHRSSRDSNNNGRSRSQRIASQDDLPSTAAKTLSAYSAPSTESTAPIGDDLELGTIYHHH